MNLLELLVLSAFALSHPLLQKLSEYPEFLDVQGIYGIRAWYFTAAILLIPGFSLYLAYRSVCAVSARLGEGLHQCFVFILVALAAATFTNDLLPNSPVGALALTLVVAAGLTYFLANSKQSRLFVSLLSPIILISPLSFILHVPPIEDQARERAEFSRYAASSASKTPIVFMVLDELPLHALLNEKDEIDAELFPNFKRLADTSYWFREATTVADETTLAVPAILTGRYPGNTIVASQTRAYPGNLFTLFQKTHELNVQENITRLCPEYLCDKAAADLPGAFAVAKDLVAVYLTIIVHPESGIPIPSLTTNWRDFWIDRDAAPSKKDRVARFEKFLDMIHPQSGAQPPLFFWHDTLPHIPYELMPSGRSYKIDRKHPRGYEDERWTADSWAIHQAYQSFLLQLVATDRLLGRLFGRLDELKLFDQSIIVLTADHGVSFEAGSYRRGNPSESRYYEDIMNVPVFMKAAGQTSGKVITENVETIDIVPSLADLIGAKIPFKIHGTSFRSGTKSPRKSIKGQWSFSGTVEKRAARRKGVRELELHTIQAPFPTRQLSKGDKAKLFPRGHGLQQLFAIGPRAEFVGKGDDEVAAGLVEVSEHVRIEGARSDNGEMLLDYDTESRSVPTRIKGDLSGLNGERAISVVVSINGKIAASTTSYLTPSGAEFTALVPEESFRVGANRVRVFTVKYEAP